MRIKNYLSYSQYSCFLSGDQNYIDRYINGIKLGNKYTDFGKKTHKELEKIEQGEKEVEIKCNFYEIPLLGIIDNLDGKKVKDYKTGKKSWTQTQADNDEQLTFYAILLSRKLNIPIEEIELELHWIGTYEDIDGEIRTTGEEKILKTRRTKLDEIKIYPKIKKVWVGIENLIDKLCIT